ncbi:hypothetical protein [Silvanigrella aquatica]|uniref:Uncharacterized protein n=1 Tax=Silvanigrella aquatica TaxID=1915309 RepID=A0A1L4D3N1_9BACT|nr:hypothetical protein [Silvanigrella aquatica]APJ04808.1 hypothetical protein AXG55_13235 [Silvanigrella aquatica]
MKYHLLKLNLIFLFLHFFNFANAKQMINNHEIRFCKPYYIKHIYSYNIDYGFILTYHLIKYYNNKLDSYLSFGAEYGNWLAPIDAIVYQSYFYFYPVSDKIKCDEPVLNNLFYVKYNNKNILVYDFFDWIYRGLENSSNKIVALYLEKSELNQNHYYFKSFSKTYIAVSKNRYLGAYSDGSRAEFLVTPIINFN